MLRNALALASPTWACSLCPSVGEGLSLSLSHTSHAQIIFFVSAFPILCKRLMSARRVHSRRVAISDLDASEFSASAAASSAAGGSGEGLILFASPSSRDILGYDAAELEGHRLDAFVHKEDVPLLRVRPCSCACVHTQCVQRDPVRVGTERVPWRRVGAFSRRDGPVHRLAPRGGPRGAAAGRQRCLGNSRGLCMHVFLYHNVCVCARAVAREPWRQCARHDARGRVGVPRTVGRCVGYCGRARPVHSQRALRSAQPLAGAEGHGSGSKAARQRYGTLPARFAAPGSPGGGGVVPLSRLARSGAATPSVSLTRIYQEVCECWAAFARV